MENKLSNAKNVGEISTMKMLSLQFQCSKLGFPASRSRHSSLWVRLRWQLVSAFLTVVFAGSIAVAEPSSDQDAMDPIIVLDAEQSKLWFEKLKSCGDLEGKKCMQDFRALLSSEQKEKFDAMREKAKGKTKKQTN